MKERPIPYTGSMVRAVLEDRKRKTRRVLKIRGIDGGQYAITLPAEEMLRFDDGTFHYRSTTALSGPYPCPYGQPGNRLWVREAWRVPASMDDLSGKQIADRCIDAGYRKPWCPIQYEADGARNSEKDWREFGSHPSTAIPGRYRHARFMPRWASRILLEITDVHVQRVQDISEEDALAEGVPFSSGLMPGGYRGTFRELWDSINGKRGFGWNVNPWVWALTFKRVEPST